MRNVWAVIKREYLQRVRSKWFIIATIAAPIFFFALFAVPAYFGARSEMSERRLEVLDRSGVLYEALAPRLEEAGYTVAPATNGPDALADLTQRASDEEIGGFLVLDEATLTSGEAIFYGASRPSAIRRFTIRQAVAQAALEYQLDREGIDAASLLQGGELRVELLSEEVGGMDDPRFAMAYVGTFLLYMVLLLYSVAVMRSTLEEKTSRVVEVIISAMKPWHLMLGKILGVGAVGLTQMGVWVASGIVLATLGLPALLAARPELAALENLKEVLPGVGFLFLFLGFFVFGFFMFSGLYAAVGAMCNTDEEAQQAQTPVMLLLIVPIVVVIGVIDDPTSNLAVGLSLVPFFSPILMFARAAGGGAPGWQVGLSFVLMGLTTVAIAWVAGRIYKVGILMAGKRPTLPELWRWVREA